MSNNVETPNGTLNLECLPTGVKIDMKCTGKEMLAFIAAMVTTACDSGVNINDLNFAVSKGMINSNNEVRQKNIDSLKSPERKAIIIIKDNKEE